jgi:hypothetical protein
MSKSRLFVSALAVAGLGAVALGYAAPQMTKAWLPNADRNSLVQAPSAGPSPAVVTEAGTRAEVPGTQAETGPVVRVDAPRTAVRVDKDSGKVAVRAPHTDVKVDPEKGQVRVRAPYVNLDIRW